MTSWKTKQTSEVICQPAASVPVESVREQLHVVRQQKRDCGHVKSSLSLCVVQKQFDIERRIIKRSCTPAKLWHVKIKFCTSCKKAKLKKLNLLKKKRALFSINTSSENKLWIYIEFCLCQQTCWILTFCIKSVCLYKQSSIQTNIYIYIYIHSASRGNTCQCSLGR